jgi:hypothetical protein
MKTLCLTPAYQDEQSSFHLDQLQGKRYLRVIKVRETIETRNDGVIIVQYDEGELANPNTDPLIIGTIVKVRGPGSVPEYAVRVLWNNKLWRTLDEDTAELMQTLTGIKGDDVRKFAERLRKSGGGLPGSCVQPPDN